MKKPFKVKKIVSKRKQLKINKKKKKKLMKNNQSIKLLNNYYNSTKMTKKKTLKQIIKIKYLNWKTKMCFQELRLNLQMGRTESPGVD